MYGGAVTGQAQKATKTLQEGALYVAALNLRNALDGGTRLISN